MFPHLSTTALLLCLANLLTSEATVRRDTGVLIKERFGDFKDACFPLPSGGCKCRVGGSNSEAMVVHKNVEDCKIKLDDVKANKARVNQEIRNRFGNYKENCFPRPSGGCKCIEKNAVGEENIVYHNSDSECKVSLKKKRAKSQNVRDPVREKAQQNYRAVVDELNEKFKGLKEGCFPRPKGCLCVIGKDRDGRDITERRMKDADCKCKPGERGNGCPAPGA